MCLYERCIINDANLYQTICLVCENTVVFKVILGNGCVGGENLVPIAVPDIYSLILKTFPSDKSGYFNNIIG